MKHLINIAFQNMEAWEMMNITNDIYMLHVTHTTVNQGMVIVTLHTQIIVNNIYRA